VAIPVFFLLLFGGLFGNALGASLGGMPSGGVDYIDYVTPAIILIAAATGGTSTALSVSMDMTEGIINRFRTMAISRASVLTGHVVGSVIQTMISIVLVIGVALLMGFRPTANLVEWVAVLGLLALLTFAIAWLSAAVGLVARGPEGASNMPIPFVLLPLLGERVRPTGVDAGRAALVRRAPALHPGHRDAAGAAAGQPDQQRRGGHARLVRRPRPGRYLWARTAFNRDPAAPAR
jgi:ABC-2 type transport system permease protein